MKKAVLIFGAALSMFASIALFANSNEIKTATKCTCTILGNKCTSNGWGKFCAKSCNDEKPKYCDLLQD